MPTSISVLLRLAHRQCSYVTHTMTQSSPSSTTSTPRAAEERMVVAVRVRPLKGSEGQRVLHMEDHKVVVLDDDASKTDILRQKRGGERRYVYDSAFGEDSTQEQVYADTTRSLVQDVLLGYNATVFAYGATGSGKTHTMVGSAHQPGIMVRALNDLFEYVRESGQADRYVVSMSYLEIYNENIRDLLNPGSGWLELREDPQLRGIKVAGLCELSTTSTEEVMRLLHKGNRARTVEPTAANKTSSRSHALLSVTVRERADPMGTRVRQGRLFMIDLAGSERASVTKNRGKRLQEGAHINRSLLALANCITALSAGARYVNFRDSKLTRLLKDALSGNCRTVMVAHVAPGARSREESRNTLLYAERARNISTKVERNVMDVTYHVSQYRAIITELREEIARLRAKMAAERPRSGEGPEHTCTHMTELREQIVAAFKEQMRLRRRLMELDATLLGLGAEAERQQLLISELEASGGRLYFGDRRSASNGLLDLDTDPETAEALQQAWSQLTFVQGEQDRCRDLREEVARELEESRRRGAALEEELPTRTSCHEERELLALMCRVHELEADKMALHTERLARQRDVRRRDALLMRYDRQRQLCELIITRQRQLMEEGCVSLPEDLQELYRRYQREIHAATFGDSGLVPQTFRDVPGQTGQPYSTYKDKLPPINQQPEPLFQRSTRFITDSDDVRRVDSDVALRTASSSADSNYSPSMTSSPLPGIPGAGVGRSAPAPAPARDLTHPPPAVLFPAIGMPRSALTTSHSDHTPPFSRLPRPLDRQSDADRAVRRAASDENLSASDKVRPLSTWHN